MAGYRYEVDDRVWIVYPYDGGREPAVIHAQLEWSGGSCRAHGDTPAYLVRRSEDASIGLYCEPQLAPREST